MSEREIIDNAIAVLENSKKFIDLGFEVDAFGIDHNDAIDVMLACDRAMNDLIKLRDKITTGDNTCN